MSQVTSSRRIGRRLVAESPWLLLAIGSLLFAYWASPLRDPTFAPNSANGGSLIPWLRSFDWIAAATVLAVVLGGKLAAVLVPSPRRRQLLSRRAPLWISLWVVLSGVLWVAFVALLLNQWLID